MRKVFFLIIIPLFWSCSQNISSVIKIVSKNNQVISVISKDSIRYIINGDFDYIPKDGFVKLGISNIGADNDAFFGCFDDNLNQWYLINPYSSIIENRLDSSKYKVSGRKVFERSEVLKFHKDDGCFEFTTSSFKIYGDTSIKLQRDFKVVDYEKKSE